MIPLLYAACCLIWGSTWLFIKLGLDGVPPFLGAGLRFALASAVLFAFALLRGASLRLDRDARVAALSCGFLSFGFSYGCVYWAEQYISSGLTAILYCMMPLMVLLLSRFWLRSERLTASKLGGILIGAAGTAILFGPSIAAGRMELRGMALVLLSAGVAAFNLLQVKRLGGDADLAVMNAWAMALGASCLLLGSALLEPGVSPRWTRGNALAIVYLALCGSVVTFSSYFYLARLMEASKLSLITLISPVVAVLLGRAALHEAIPPSTWLGMGVVLGGVALALFGERRVKGSVNNK